jgi:hypothetical protein
MYDVFDESMWMKAIRVRKGRSKWKGVISSYPMGSRRDVQVYRLTLSSISLNLLAATSKKNIFLFSTPSQSLGNTI